MLLSPLAELAKPLPSILWSKATVKPPLKPSARPRVPFAHSIRLLTQGNRDHKESSSLAAPRASSAKRHRQLMLQDRPACRALAGRGIGQPYLLAMRSTRGDHNFNTDVSIVKQSVLVPFYPLRRKLSVAVLVGRFRGQPVLARLRVPVDFPRRPTKRENRRPGDEIRLTPLGTPNRRPGSIPALPLNLDLDPLYRSIT